MSLHPELRGLMDLENSQERLGEEPHGEAGEAAARTAHAFPGAAAARRGLQGVCSSQKPRGCLQMQ